MRRAAAAGAIAALLALPLAPAPGALAAPAEPTGPPAAAPAEPAPAPPPTLSASLDTTATAVGAPLALRLDASAAPGWRVLPPTKSIDLGPFRLRSIEPVLDTGAGAGAGAGGGGGAGAARAWRLRLVAVQPGDLELPAIELSARGPDGAETTIASEPIPVRVASSVPAPAPAGAPADSAGAASPDAGSAAPERAEYKPPLEAPRDWLPLVVAIVAALVAGVVAWQVLRRLRRRTRSEAPARPAPRRPLRPAWESAIESLDRIVAAGYPERGELDRQYVEVTEALRRYLEERWGVPALESTTDELRGRFRASPVAPEVQTRVLAILREADLVKFAKGATSAEEARAVESRARSVVLDTVPDGAAAPGPAAEAAA